MLFLVCLCSSVFICHNQWSLFINKRLSLCLFINSHKLQPLMEFCIHNKIRGWSLFNTDWYQGSKHNIKIISSFFKQFLGMGKILSFPLSHFFFPLSLAIFSSLFHLSIFLSSLSLSFPFSEFLYSVLGVEEGELPPARVTCLKCISECSAPKPHGELLLHNVTVLLSWKLVHFILAV